MTGTQTAASQLRSLLAGATVAQAIFVAAKLNVADLLAEGPRSAAELAAASGADPASLHRIMRALASIGVFACDPAGRFLLTPVAQLLRGDADGSLRDYAVMNGEQFVWRALGGMEYSVRTGQPSFEHIFGARLFDYYAANPEAGRISAAALNNLSAVDNAAIVAAWRFPDSATVIDVGGGKGSLLGAILSANPKLRGVLFERPPVIEMARPILRAVGDRCALVAGDFFDAIPPLGDVYLMKKVVHDWDDEAAIRLLRCCRAAMADTATLLVAEMIVPDGNAPSASTWLDLLMLVYTGGRERTEAEYRRLLAAAGFGSVRVIPTDADIWLIEACPVVSR